MLVKMDSSIVETLFGKYLQCCPKETVYVLTMVAKVEGWNFSLIFNVPRGEGQYFQTIPADGSA